MHKQKVIKILLAVAITLILIVLGYFLLVNGDIAGNSNKSVDYCSSEEFVSRIEESRVLFTNDIKLLNDFSSEIVNIKDYQSSADCMYIVFLNSLFDESSEDVDKNYDTLLRAYETKPYSDNVNSLYFSPSELQEITKSIKETREHNSTVDGTIDNSFDGTVDDR